jgi:hypothetical protein
MNEHNRQHTTFREIAGIITAMIVVLLFAGLGIIQVVVNVITGINVQFDPDYKTALLGLASMALGFLVGSQSDNKSQRQLKAVTTGTVIDPEGYTTTQSVAMGDPPNEGTSGKK